MDKLFHKYANEICGISITLIVFCLLLLLIDHIYHKEINNKD